MAFKNYEEWIASVPARIRDDPLWEFETYRRAAFLADLVWFDAEKLLHDPRGRGLAWQIVDSAGSVAANIEEGYGRGFSKDYARFLRIAVGSARETKGWYFRARHVFGDQVVNHRLGLLDDLISNLITVANQQRHE
jgi:four helix bundle protein